MAPAQRAPQEKSSPKLASSIEEYKDSTTSWDAATTHLWTVHDSFGLDYSHESRSFVEA